MKKNAMLAMLLIISNLIFAQYSEINENEIDKIKNSILLVIMEVENPKTLKNLSKKQDKLEHYKAQILGRNNVLKLAVNNYWNYTDSVLVLTKSEANILIKNEHSYITLSYGIILDYVRLSTIVGSNGKPAGWSHSYRGTSINQMSNIGLSYNPSTKYTSLANIVTTLKLSGIKKPMNIYLPNVYPSYSDVIYGIKQLQYTIKFYENNPDASVYDYLKQIKLNNSQLKEKILLISEDDMHKKLTIEKIEKVYPFKFEIVNQDFIEKVIIEESEKYAYIQIVDRPSGKGNASTHIVSNSSDGMIYCFDYPKVAFGLKHTSLITLNKRIKVKNLKNYVKNSDYNNSQQQLKRNAGK